MHTVPSKACSQLTLLPTQTTSHSSTRNSLKLAETMRLYSSRLCLTHLLTITSSTLCAPVLLVKGSLRTLEDTAKASRHLTIRGSTHPGHRARQYLDPKVVSLLILICDLFFPLTLPARPSAIPGIFTSASVPRPEPRYPCPFLCGRSRGTFASRRSSPAHFARTTLSSKRRDAAPGSWACKAAACAYQHLVTSTTLHPILTALGPASSAIQPAADARWPPAEHVRCPGAGNISLRLSHCTA